MKIRSSTELKLLLKEKKRNGLVTTKAAWLRRTNIPSYVPLHGDHTGQKQI